MKNLFMNKISFLTIFIWLWGLSIVLASGNIKYTPEHREFLKIEPVFDLTIMGSSIATREQCVNYLFRHNSFPLINTTPKQLVDYYYAEGGLEGIRPDLAFAQALHETGNFGYGGDVISLQNNYCGLGTTGNGVKGAWFSSVEIVVRAQIQHLLAYTTTRPPTLTVVDPRYELVKKTEKFGQSYTWTALNGKWAVPGRTYGQMILKIHQKIITGQ